MTFLDKGSGNVVYHATAQTGGAAVRVSVNQGKVTTEPLYFDKRLPGMTGGTVLIEGTLYGSNMVSMIAADFATGVIKWQDRSIGAASVTAADGLLFLHGENGDAALVSRPRRPRIAKRAGSHPRTSPSGGRATPVSSPRRGRTP